MKSNASMTEIISEQRFNYTYVSLSIRNDRRITNRSTRTDNETPTCHSPIRYPAVFVTVVTNNETLLYSDVYE